MTVLVDMILNAVHILIVLPDWSSFCR
jgi:hypothetical protein